MRQWVVYRILAFFDFPLTKNLNDRRRSLKTELNNCPLDPKKVKVIIDKYKTMDQESYKEFSIWWRIQKFEEYL